MIHDELTQLTVAIDSVKNHPRNIRQGDVGAISQSLKENGQYRPIVVQKSTGYVLAGNHTLKAAKALGWKTIAATMVDCDDDRALRILLADNKTNDLASYDENALSELLKELASTEQGLSGTLYTGDDLDDMLFKADFTHGNASVGVGVHDVSDEYYDKGIRSLILVYKEETHHDLVKRLDEIGEKLNLDNHSDVVRHLIEKWK
jgi:uncharacterized ParB-like nuclease family protein